MKKLVILGLGLMIFSVAGFITYSAGTPLDPNPEGSYVWDPYTQAAAARNSVNECGFDSLCMELCFIDHDGNETAMGMFRCS